MELNIGHAITTNNHNTLVVESRLGEGGFGVVYKVVDSCDNTKRYALKTISGNYSERDKLALENEGQKALLVRHENVVQIYEYSLFDGIPYILMEYVPCGNLQTLILDQARRGCPFAPDAIIDWYTQLAKGMKAINTHLFHRDLKPDNILYDGTKLKIADFGLSKLIDIATRTKTFKGVQHPMFKAPEAWKGETNTILMDIYQMGLVYFQIAALRHAYDVNLSEDPFASWREAHLYQRPKRVRDYNSELEICHESLIEHMLDKEVNKRPQNWDEVLSWIIKHEKKDNNVIQIPDFSRMLISTEELKKERISRYKEKDRVLTQKKRLRLRADEIENMFRDIATSFEAQAGYCGLRVVRKDEEDFFWLFRTPPTTSIEISRTDIYGSITCRIYPGQEAKYIGRDVIAIGSIYRYKPRKKGGIFAWDNSGFNVLLVESEDARSTDWIAMHNYDRRFFIWPAAHSFAWHYQEVKKRLNNPGKFGRYRVEFSRLDIEMIIPYVTTL